MNISNYKAETERLKKEYATALKMTPSVMDLMRTELTKAIGQLEALERANPAYAHDIKACRQELEIRQKNLSDVLKKNKKDKTMNVIKGARKAFGTMHKITEAPVDFVKKGIGLK